MLDAIKAILMGAGAEIMHMRKLTENTVRVDIYSDLYHEKALLCSVGYAVKIDGPYTLIVSL
jgi:hypothetical protein